MTTSFYNGITGLKSFQNGINIWGDNISNINTPAFKESIPEFATLFSQAVSSSPVSSDIGLGSYFDSSAKNLQKGSLIGTDNPFDIALDNNGWFQVTKEKKGYYTRNGTFTRDKNGFLTGNGAYLTVANANNLQKTANGYTINTSVNTDNLIDTGSFSPISLPNNVTLPAIPTTEIKIKANLDNAQKLLNPKNATKDLYFSALYDKSGNELGMNENQSFAYTLGDKITYKNSLFKKEICINDDKKDGKDLIYDFSVNGKNINATIPDGSTKKDIINILANKLKNSGINYETTDNSIIIESPDNLTIKSNNTLVNSASGVKFTYKDKPSNDYEFNTMQNLADNLKKALNTIYPNASTSVENGKIAIQNNGKNTIISQILPTDNTNKLFIQNLEPLTHSISPDSKLDSFKFGANIKSFGGYIYEKDGSKDTVSFNFAKKEIVADNTIWQAVINTIKNNKTLSTQTQDFTFNKNGFLLSPKSIELKSPPIKINTDLSSFVGTGENISYSYTQNGTSEGSLQQYAIDKNGNIFANFSNGKSVKLATIPVYHFRNDQGLKSIGDSLFKQTDNSNKAFLYENGKYIPGAEIHSHTLESSNVNFAQAMTELIINQKAFSAAAKTVTTSDQMIQKAINMKK